MRHNPFALVVLSFMALGAAALGCGSGNKCGTGGTKCSQSGNDGGQGDASVGGTAGGGGAAGNGGGNGGAGGGGTAGSRSDGGLPGFDAALGDGPARSDGAATDGAARDGTLAANRDGTSGDLLGDRRPDVIPALTIDQVCADFGTKACDRLNACARQQFLLSYGTAKVCAERLRVACLIEATAPGARVFANPLDLCVRSLEIASCDEVLNGNALSSCYPAGTRPGGARCATMSQCQSGYCRLDTGCGVCTVRSGAGATCDSTRQDDLQCTQGQTCVGNLCTAHSMLGQACGPTQVCQRPLACIVGKCVVALEANALCAEPGECNTSAGLTCGGNARCGAVAFPAVGARCTPAGIPCLGGAVCARDAQGNDRCVAPALDAFGCGPNFDNKGCLAPAVCVNAICTLPSPASCN